MRRAAEISRRASLGLLAAGAAGLVAMPRRRADIPAGRVVVTYWEKWTGREGVAMQEVVDLFNASQGSAWVDRVPVSEIVPKAMVAIAGDDPPDVVGLYSYNLPHFAESGAIFPFNHFGGVGNPYAPGVGRLLSHRGRQWAGVNTCYTLALYINRELVRAGGFDPDRPPSDTEDLLRMAVALTKRSRDGSIQLAGFLQNLPGWWPYSWPALFDAPLTSPDHRFALLTEPRCVEAFDWIARTSAGVGPGASRAFAASFGRSIHSREDPFISGRLAMVVQGPWLAAFIRDHRPELDYSCVPIPLAPGRPRRDQPPGMLEADVLCIPRGARHPHEAWAFVTFTQRREVQEHLARRHAKGSPMATLSPGFGDGHPNPFVGVFDAAARSDRVQVLPQTRAWKAYADLLTSGFDAIWGGAPAAGVLASLQPRAQALLDRAYAAGTRRA